MKPPTQPHPVTQIIINLYGSQIEFARKHKIHRHTASKYYNDPESMPFGMVVKLCKRAGININIITKTKQNNEEL